MQGMASTDVMNWLFYYRPDGNNRNFDIIYLAVSV
jgi:hypothetical protein